MMHRKVFSTVLLVLIILLAFSAGRAWERFRYEDICLDLGGGMYPEGYPICVVEGAVSD
jgi:hypothetical protein